MIYFASTLTSRIVENNASKMVQAEGRINIGFWLQVVSMGSVGLVQFSQHSLISALQ